MKIALVLNRLAIAPTEEEREINTIRRRRHNQTIADTVRCSGHEICFIEDNAQLQENLAAYLPDLVFLQTFRADPGASILKIQALLEEMGLPYTGSPPEACRLGQNKYLAKQKFQQSGLPTPAFALVEEAGSGQDAKPEGLNFPLFIKPLYGGCSMGIHPDNPVFSAEAYRCVLAETLLHSRQPALVEEFREGREFSAGVLGNKPPAALPLIEYLGLGAEAAGPHFRRFDKKTDQEVHENYACPAELDKSSREKIENLAVAAFQALGCRDYARVDIRCDKEGNPFLLEVNIHPSLLPDSSLPIMAAKANIPYPQLFNQIFQSALSRWRESDI